MKLFDRVKIGNLELKNRFVLAPMGTKWAAEYRTDERAFPHFERRAVGGFGLIMQGYQLSSKFEAPQGNNLEKRGTLIPLTDLCDRIHSAGSKICVQLSPGVGRNGWFVDGEEPPKSSCNNNWFWNPDVKCTPLTKDEIQELVEAFRVGAEMSRLAGADMVNLSVYGGYLMDQFLTPLWNHRTDEYGGSFENRMRFLKETYDVVRATVGNDMPITVKYTAEHGIPGGRTLEDEGIKMALEMESWGVDGLVVDLGCYERWYLPIGTVYSKDAYHNFMGEALKKAGVKIPLFIGGNLRKPEVARNAVESGIADFVMIGRQSKADPDYVNKIKHGDEEDIRPCIGCNECLYSLTKGTYSPGCAVNPLCFNELDYPIIPAEKPKNVLVIGGGPGGMQAALIAKQRGHNVQLWEKDDKLGGNLLAAGAPSFKGRILEFIDYLALQLKKSGIPVFYNKKATLEEIQQNEIDHIICAVGSSPMKLSIPGIDGSNVGCEAAAQFAETADKVTIVEILDDILLTADHCKNNDQELRHLIDEAKVNIECCTKALSIEEDHVVCEKNGETFNIPCDKVVVAVGYRSNSEIVEELKANYDYEQLDIIGDANKAGKVVEAIHEGFHAARHI